MPRSLVALQEDDGGNFIIATLDHASGEIEIHRKLRSLTSEGSVSGFIAGDEKVAIWSMDKQLTIRNLDGEILHEVTPLLQYINGGGVSMGPPFASWESWDSYGDVFYGIYTRDWDNYKLYLVDCTGAEITESETLIDFTGIPTFVRGKFFYTPTNLFVVGLTNDNFVKVFKQVVGENSWTEISSTQVTNKPCFQFFRTNRVRNEKRFYFSSSNQNKHLDCLVLNITTGNVTYLQNFITDAFPTESGLFSGTTELGSIETGKSNEWWSGGFQYIADPLSGYSSNIVRVAGQGQDGVSDAFFFDRTKGGFDTSYYTSQAWQAIIAGNVNRVNFKPDLTEIGVFISYGSTGKCLLITPDGKLQLRNGYNATLSTILGETVAGFIQGGVYNKFTIGLNPNNGDLIVANDTGSGPVIHTFPGINGFTGYLGMAGRNITDDFKCWDGYVDGVATYYATWENLDHIGKTLFDVTPTIDDWDTIIHVPYVNREVYTDTTGDFVKWIDNSTTPAYGFRHALDPAFSLATNHIDHERNFALIFANGDDSNERVGTGGGIYNIDGTDVALYITARSMEVISKATGDIVHEYVHENNNYRDFGNEYCQAVLPATVDKTITGYVRDASNNARVGIIVQMLSEDCQQKLAQTVTDADGRYTFQCFTMTEKTVIYKDPSNPAINFKVRGHLVPA